VWALTYGTWGSLHHPDDPVDASWQRNRAQILQAEALGYDATLVAEHLINPFGDEHDQLETWTASAALAALTSKIEIIAAIKPYLFHPVVLAKMALQIGEISNSRFSINLVNAWYVAEFERAGITFADHDERYAYGTEWLTVVKSLMTGARTNFNGKYFNIDEYELRPAPSDGRPPTVYVGGESGPARELVAGHADVWFINGKPRDEVAQLIADVRRRPRSGAPIRFGLVGFVIARDTDAEAKAEFQYLWQLGELDQPMRERLFRNADPKAVQFQQEEANPHVGTNGGTNSGLVGSYDTVAERIRDFDKLGIEIFMLQFQPFESEMQRFAEEVIPRVRRLSRVAA
jgi:alkanesulfonate monooxygenase